MERKYARYRKKKTDPKPRNRSKRVVREAKWSEVYLFRTPESQNVAAFWLFLPRSFSRSDTREMPFRSNSRHFNFHKNTKKSRIL